MCVWQRNKGFAKLIFNVAIPNNCDLKRKYKICNFRNQIQIREKDSDNSLGGVNSCIKYSGIDYHLKKDNIDIIVWDYNITDTYTLEITTYKANVVNKINELVFCSKDGLQYNLNKDLKKEFVFFTNNGYPCVFVCENKKDKNTVLLLGKNKYAVAEIMNKSVFCITKIQDDNEPFSNKDAVCEIYEYYVDTVSEKDSIRFISYETAFNYTNTGTINVSVENIFKIWSKYTGAIKKIMDDKIHDIGKIRYTKNKDIISFEIPTEKAEKYDAFLKSSYFECGNIRINPYNMQSIEIDENNTRYSFSDRNVLDRKSIKSEGFLSIAETPEYKNRKKIIRDIFNSIGDATTIIRDFCNDNFSETESLTLTEKITKGLTEEVARKVYGKKTPTEVDNYEYIDEIIKCAVNSPDICLIQGPAGTGKTTIIKAIITRLKEKDKNTKFLVCAEQHDAVQNLMDKISGGDTSINYVFSTRYDKITNKSESNKDLDNMLEKCTNFLSSKPEEDANDCIIDDILAYITDKQYDLARKEIESIKNNIDTNNYDKAVYIINLLDKKTEINFIIDVMCSAELKEYFDYDFCNGNIQKYTDSQIRELLKNILKECLSLGQTNEMKTIINEFAVFIQTKGVFSDSMRKYADTMGGTCNQSYKADRTTITNNSKVFPLYDYVIIDEAARANPLDVMRPISMGKHVILVGDHKQLPHYISSEEYQEFANSENDTAKILKQSLFGQLFRNVQKAQSEGRLKSRRAFMLNKQYRMPSILGTFISDNFYDSELKNGIRENCSNTYDIFNGKNIVFLDVPFFVQPEQRKNASLSRDAEVDQVIDIVKQLIQKKKNNDKKIDLGIISFYKRQVEKISAKLQEITQGQDFKDIFKNNIDDTCGTVDSFQGKEFDIVILSCVRSKKGKGSLGFLETEEGKCRINVALSRAKQLLIVIGDMETLEGIGQNDTENDKMYFENLKTYIKQNPDTCEFITKG